MNAWSDTRRLEALPFFFAGEAAAYFWQLPAEKRATYASVKDAMLRTFGDTADGFALHERVYQRIKRPDESVKAYARALESLATKAGFSDDAKRAAFLRGLPVATRGNLATLLTVNEPKTFAEVVEVASKVETLSKEVPKATALFADAEEKPARDPLHDTLARLTDILAVQVATAGPTRRPERPVRCFECDEEGHFARDCRRRQPRFDRESRDRRIFASGYEAKRCSRRSVWRQGITKSRWRP